MPLFGERDPAVWKQLAEKTWEELGVAEQCDRVLFPEEILRRQRDGKLRGEPIMLRVPREPELRRARVAARQWAAEEKLDPKLDADLFDNLETFCILTLAIRNRQPDYEQWIVAGEKNDLVAAAKLLEKNYDRGSIKQLWSKLEAYSNAVDPRPESFTEDQLLAVIAAIAKRRDISPLLAFGGQSQNDLLVAMASRLQSFLDPKFSSEPSDSSTADD